MTHLRGSESDPCPYVTTNDEGTSYCRLAESSVKRLEEEVAWLRTWIFKLHPHHADAVAAIQQASPDEPALSIGQIRQYLGLDGSEVAS